MITLAVGTRPPVRPRGVGPILALAAALLLSGCPGRDAADAGVQRFEAELHPVRASGVTGTAAVEMDERSLRVSVFATGLEPGARISQHLNTRWDCATIGRILVNLDTLLTVPGEGPPRGGDYPRVDGQGRLSYTATRELSELSQALGHYRGMSIDDFDLANRTIFLRDDAHRPIACGELEAGITRTWRSRIWRR